MSVVRNQTIRTSEQRGILLKSIILAYPSLESDGIMVRRTSQSVYTNSQSQTSWIDMHA